MSSPTKKAEDRKYGQSDCTLVVEELTCKCAYCGLPIDYGVFSNKVGNQHFLGYYCSSNQCVSRIVAVSLSTSKPSLAEHWLEQIEEGLYALS